MASRSGPVHVATTRRTYKGKVYESHLLRRTYREGGKVKHETLGNLSHLPPEVIGMIRGVLRGEAYVPAAEAWEIVRSLPHGHVAAVLGTLRRLGIDRLLEERRSRRREVAVALVAARLLEPSSKLATSRALQEATRSTSLGETVAWGVDEDVLYETLDWMATRQERVERALAARHLKEGMLVLYDLTSVAYTGQKCPLARHGHSKEGNAQDPQIEFGLVCDEEGRPLAVEVFEGNTADPKTLGAQIEKVQQRFGLKRVVVVGDRGMITDARVREDLKPAAMEWITALRAPAIRRLVERGALQLSLFDQRDLAEITLEQYPGERLIACRNPLLAAERARKREELLKTTEQGLDAIVAATKREKRRLQGERAIALRVGRVLDRSKMGKHFTWSITAEGVLSYARKQDQIAQEAALDGIYIVRTNVPKERMAGPAVVAAYKRLADVERAFRSLKTVDLKVRPIYHRLERRVRAHVFLCMLAYYVEWHMREALAPLLFEDADPKAGEALRTSVVEPAQRSPEAQAKASTKRTANGEPVHSFQTLMRDLATITKNRVRLPAKGSAPAQEFDKVTIPTSLQRRALGLLNVSLTT